MKSRKAEEQTGFEPLLFRVQEGFYVQRLFSDEQFAVIRNACAFALEDGATPSYAEKMLLRSVQEQIKQFLPEQQTVMEQTMQRWKPFSRC